MSITGSKVREVDWNPNCQGIGLMRVALVSWIARKATHLEHFNLLLHFHII